MYIRLQYEDQSFSPFLRQEANNAVIAAEMSTCLALKNCNILGSPLGMLWPERKPDGENLFAKLIAEPRFPHSRCLENGIHLL